MKKILLILFICSGLFSKSQNFEWAKAMISNNILEVREMKIDNSGNILISGFYRGALDLDPGTGTATYNANDISFDMYLAKYDSLGNYLWGWGIGNSNGNDRIFSMVLDSLGNSYLVGEFSDTTDFDPGPGNAIFGTGVTPASFLLKYDTNGALIWSNFLGNASSYPSILTSGFFNNELIIGGFFTGTVDFDPGPSVYNLTAFNSSANPFLAKYNINGDIVMAKNFDVTQGGLYISSLNLDYQGNILITGQYSGTIDFNVGSGVYNLSSNNGSADMFVAKYDNNINLLWAAGFGNTQNEIMEEIFSDYSGNIYCSGTFTGTVDFDPGPTVNSFASANGSADIFLSKFNSNGIYQWTNHFTSNSVSDMPYDLTCDIYDNVYLIGNYGSIIDADPGPGVFNLSTLGGNYNGIILGKYSPSGNLLSAFSIGGTGYDWGSQIEIKNGGAFTISGIFHSSVDFDPSTDSLILNAPVQSSIFIAHYSQPTPSAILALEDIATTMQCYPNPTDGKVIIDLGKQFSNLQLELYDITGKKINTSSFYSTKTIKFDLNVDSGIYFLEVKTNDNSVFFKIIKK